MKDANDNSLTTLDELAIDPKFPHPLEQRYRENAKSLGRKEDSFFVAYDDAISGKDEGASPEIPPQAIALKPLGARQSYRLDPGHLVVGLICEGGLAPGMNTIIDSIVKRHSLLATISGVQVNEKAVSTDGLELRGYFGGISGLLNHQLCQLQATHTDDISLTPGSLLGCGSNNDFGQLNKVTEAIRSDGLDILYIIGDQQALRLAEQISLALRQGGVVGRKMNQPVRVVFAPATIHNDIGFTDVTLSFNSAVESAKDYIGRAHCWAKSSHQLAVVEIPDNGSGFLAMRASSASGEVDCLLIPQMLGAYHDMGKRFLQRTIPQLAYRWANKQHALLVVAEGTLNSEEGHSGGNALELMTYEAFFNQVKNCFSSLPNRSIFSEQSLKMGFYQLKNLVGCAPPVAEDINLCKLTGRLMVEAALSGLGCCVVCLWKGHFVAVPMSSCLSHLKQVDIHNYEFVSMLEKYSLAKDIDKPTLKGISPSEADQISDFFG